jgi:hypothetical protein
VGLFANAFFLIFGCCLYGIKKGRNKYGLQS